MKIDIHHQHLYKSSIISVIKDVILLKSTLMTLTMRSALEARYGTERKKKHLKSRLFIWQRFLNTPPNRHR